MKTSLKNTKNALLLLVAFFALATSLSSCSKKDCKHSLNPCYDYVSLFVEKFQMGNDGHHKAEARFTFTKGIDASSVVYEKSVFAYDGNNQLIPGTTEVLDSNILVFKFAQPISTLPINGDSCNVRFVLKGDITAGNAVRSNDGSFIDGDADWQEGGDFIQKFNFMGRN
jgi:hypothetical protein